MKPVKYTLKDTRKINLKTKLILKYPTPTKKMDIGYMIVKGRYPEDKNSYMLEHKCNFVIFIIKGRGIVNAGDETYKVKPKDVVFVPAKNKFAVKGNFEYITVDCPAFSPDQAEEIKVK